MQALTPTIWQGCYEDSWKGLFSSEEAFGHPAKFARGLIRRIYQHLRDQYGLQPGSVVVDPFGGIACGALDAMEMGYQWVGVELEANWHGIAEQNIAKWQRYFPNATARIVCGDSRRLRECVGLVLAQCIVGSPPFISVLPGGSKQIINGKTFRVVRVYQPDIGKISSYLTEMRKAKFLSHKQVCEAGGFYSKVNHGGSSANWEAGLSLPTPDQWLKLKSILDLDDRFDREMLTFQEVLVADNFKPTNDTTNLLSENYGTTPGQLGAMQAGSVNCVLSSPPYAETLKGEGGQTETAAESRAKRQSTGGSLDLGQSQRTRGYGAKGNLGNLPAGEVAAVIGSPPFAGSDQPCASQTQAKKDYHAFTRSDGTKRDHSMQTDGNLASLPEGTVDAACDAVVASPPYESSLDNILPHAEDGHDGGAVATFRRTGKWPERRPLGLDYGKGDDNLGNSTGDTFWSAAKTILEECHAILRPGGLAVWVVKAFVRKGAIVDFPGDWRRLCESVGFVTVEEIHAGLIKTHEHPGLFGEPVTKSKSRKSFFRRLHEKRRPDLAIDHETVWIMRKEN